MRHQSHRKSRRSLRTQSQIQPHSLRQVLHHRLRQRRTQRTRPTHRPQSSLRHALPKPQHLTRLAALGLPTPLHLQHLRHKNRCLSIKRIPALHRHSRLHSRTLGPPCFMSRPKKDHSLPPRSFHRRHIRQLHLRTLTQHRTLHLQPPPFQPHHIHQQTTPIMQSHPKRLGSLSPFLILNPQLFHMVQTNLRRLRKQSRHRLHLRLEKNTLRPCPNHSPRQLLTTPPHQLHLSIHSTDTSPQQTQPPHQNPTSPMSLQPIHDFTSFAFFAASVFAFSRASCLRLTPSQ